MKNKPPKKTEAAKKEPVSQKAKPAAFHGSGVPKWMLIPIGILLVIITRITYSPAEHAHLLNWDDNLYITENNLLNSGTPQQIWTTPVAGNYHPLTIFSLLRNYADYGLVQLTNNSALQRNQVGKANISLPVKEEYDGSGYHAENIFWHCCNVLLVLAFIFLLTGSVVTATITAALFAVHPMHVESVAWVSERKDVLYTFFYMAALCTYVLYGQKNMDKYRLWLYMLTLVLFALSLLSKAQAVTLPVVLLLVDYYSGKPFWHWKYLKDKIPFFTLSLAFGIGATMVQKSSGGYIASVVRHPFFQQLQYGFEGLVLYIAKLVAPVGLSAFYPYPAQASIIYLLLVLAGGTAIIYLCRKNKIVLFGVGFFLITILPVLQFLPVGKVLMADRYSYIPYTGLFFIAAVYADVLWAKLHLPAYRWLIGGAVATCVLLLGIISYNRSEVWFNDETLWKAAIQQNPANGFALAQYGDRFYSKGDYTAAKPYLQNGLKLEPDNEGAEVTLGNIYFVNDQSDSAILHYRRALKTNPDYEPAWKSMGMTFVYTGKMDSAADCFNQCIRITMDYPPLLAGEYTDIGKAYQAGKWLDSAQTMFNRASRARMEESAGK